MNEVEVAVMLADLSGSTALYEEVGNAEAHRRVSACIALFRRIIEFHGGEFISSKGDDILCTFGRAGAALDAGMEIFEATGDSTLSVHAGVDFGHVIRTHDDVFGDSVNMAARLAAVARPGEILCGQNLYDKLDNDARKLLRFFGPRHFKGKTATSNIYLFSHAGPGQATEINFAEVDADDRPDRTFRDDGGVKAALRFCNETFVSQSDRPVSMGRSAECDLVVPLPWVSRAHATVEVRGDIIYLNDTSSSGTCVLFEGQPPFRLRRETLVLHQSCTLSLARMPGEKGAQVISVEPLVPTGGG